MNTLGLSADLLKQIVDAIVRHAHPKKIVVYGSRARGDFSQASDVDIAVECEKGEEFIRNVIDDDVRTLLKLDIVNVDKIDQKLREEIRKEGTVVYEKA
jgi:predicted nucleotidyltransferase